ncbi:hypothetical protein ONZ45_g12757 [Pleurotus djamor]|nr:hypothetical protein ONZ45_g12757 [Pleurotus djamor]
MEILGEIDVAYSGKNSIRPTHLFIVLHKSSSVDDSSKMSSTIRHIMSTTAASSTPASSIIEVAYGITVEPKDDPMVAVADHAMNFLNNAGIPGTYLVDHIPILRYIPSWLPGAQFQKFAKAAYSAAQDMINVPYANVRERLTVSFDGEQIKGEAPPCVVSRAFAREEKYLGDPEMEAILKDVASVAYAGGVDTTNPPLLAFAAAMVLFPEVQKKAQLEVDTVLNGRCLPSFEDQSLLPYSQAVMWELFRWKTVLPLGVAHRTITDDIYSGFFIPGGSIVLANVWAIMRDEQLFPQPDEFRPERFINEDGSINRKLTEAVEITFGLGRRICPGRFFARDTVWLWITSLLSVFNINPAKDANGQKLLPDVDLLPLFITRIKSLECDITPRSKEAVKLIRDSELELDLDVLAG